MVTISRTDDTQADFQEGVLTDVEADAGGFLRLMRVFLFYSPSSGNRISPQIDLSKAVTVKSSSISWTATLNDQTINIETRVSFDGGLTWTVWSSCTNGNSIPNLTPSTQVINALLECRQTLSTTSSLSSPQLEKLNITIEGIGMTLFQSFNF